MPLKLNCGLSKKLGLQTPVATLGVLALLSCERQPTDEENGLPPPKPEAIHWRGEETGYQAGINDTADQFQQSSGERDVPTRTN